MVDSLQTILTPNAGLGTFTVLTPANAAAVNNSIFLNQINALNTPQIVQAQNRVQSTLQRELNQLGDEQIALTDLQDEIDNALKFINDGISRATLIHTRLDAAIKTALQANEGDANSFPALAASFDSSVNSIIDTANTGPTPNLLSELPQSNLTFRLNTRGTTLTLSPKFLGTNYTVTEDVSGDVFVRVDSTKTFRETSAADGTFTGNFGAIFGGIRMDSFDASTNAIGFTTSPSTAGAQSFTGTLSKTGLGVGNAFIYDNLESQAGRDRAIADLESAKISVDQQLIRFKAALAQAQLSASRTSTRLNDLLVETETLTFSASVEIQGIAARAEGLNQLNVNLLQSQKAFRQELLNLIPVKGVIGKVNGLLLDLAI